MALDIAIDRDRWRWDSTLYPLISVSGIDGDIGIVKIGNQHYLDDVTADFWFPFQNRSQTDLPVTLREGIAPVAWVHEGTEGDGHGPIACNMGTSGDFGAYYDTDLSPIGCSVEGRIPVDLGTVQGISLQNGDGTIVHDYTETSVAHSMSVTIGDPSTNRGLGEIRELGELVPVGGNFVVDAGDKLLLELTDGVVRYYLVKPDRSMVLLRTTRSKLTAAPKAELRLAGVGSTFTEVNITDTAAFPEASTSIEIVAVLENFQDWNNEMAIQTTADAILMANNEPQFTYPNPKRTLRALNANLALRTKQQRWEFEDFFNWHGNEKEFIFIDKAKLDRDDRTTEWWARFGSAFGDKSRSQCLSAHTAQIIESYRRDFLAKYGISLLGPTIDLPAIGDPVGNGDVTLEFTIVGTEGELVYSYDVYLDGNLSGSTRYLDPLEAGFGSTVEFVVHAGSRESLHTVWIVATNYHGRTGESTHRTYDFTVV